MFFKAHTIHVALYKSHTLCAETCFGGDDMHAPFRPDAAMPASIREGVEFALGLMQRLFGLVVDCSVLRCVDIKLSVTNLHI